MMFGLEEQMKMDKKVADAKLRVEECEAAVTEANKRRDEAKKFHVPISKVTLTRCPLGRIEKLTIPDQSRSSKVRFS